MWLLLHSVGLLLVLEGILPFLSPRFWRKLMQQMFMQNDHVLRVMSLISMLIGLVLIYTTKNFLG